MEGGSSSRVNIVILDACRTNRSFRSFRSSLNGLSQPRIQPVGSIIAFSTAPGTVAYDGEGRNSPYVSELSKHLLTPGLKIEDIFKRVRIGVRQRTSRKPTPQIPWENSSLMGDFYFIYTDGVTSQQPSYSEDKPNLQNQESNIHSDNQINITDIHGDEMWNLIKDSKDVNEFKLFLESYPNSRHKPLIKLKIHRINEKEKTKKRERPYFDVWIKTERYPGESIEESLVRYTKKFFVSRNGWGYIRGHFVDQIKKEYECFKKYKDKFKCYK